MLKIGDLYKLPNKPYPFELHSIQLTEPRHCSLHGELIDAGGLVVGHFVRRTESGKRIGKIMPLHVVEHVGSGDPENAKVAKRVREIGQPLRDYYVREGQ